MHCKDTNFKAIHYDFDYDYDYDDDFDFDNDYDFDYDNDNDVDNDFVVFCTAKMQILKQFTTKETVDSLCSRMDMGDSFCSVACDTCGFEDYTFVSMILTFYEKFLFSFVVCQKYYVYL